jgi:folate-dependent phosphoribosylglycinamide formyltransferase PurN
MDVALLAGRTLDEFQLAVLDTFLNAPPSTRVVGCVIDARPVPSPWRRGWTNLARGRGGYVAIMALSRAKRRVSTTFDTEAVLDGLRVPIIRTDDPYCQETLLKIRGLQAEVLVLLGGFGIVKQPLLSLVPEGVLSYHHGDMRKYRGQPPGFWELYHGEERIGVTVQRLSPGIDCGEPILERSFAIQRDDTLRSLSRRMFLGSSDMMLAAVRRLEDPSFRAESLGSFGKLHTLPNLRQWLVLQIRIGRRVLSVRAGRRRP